MKKLFFSLGAILFSSVLLASCNAGSGISVNKPKKGMPVDKVEFLTGDYGAPIEISIRKSDSFEDVYNTLGNYYDIGLLTDIEYINSRKLGWSQKASVKADFKATNYYRDDENIIVKKYKNNIKYSLEEDAYFEGSYTPESGTENYKEEGNYYNKKITNISTKTSYDGLDSNRKVYQEIGIAGYLLQKKSNNGITRVVDLGNYNNSNYKYLTETLSDKNIDEGSLNEYYYVNEYDNSNDPNYGATYEGYDKDDKHYSYSVSDYFDGDMADELFFYNNSKELSSLYNPEYSSFYTCSFELTDKYIIIKTKTTFFEAIYDETINYFTRLDKTDYDEDDITNKMKELYDKKYKGSYSEQELWINYTHLYENTDNYHNLTCDYYKNTTKNYDDYSGTYDDEYFKLNLITNEDVQNSLRGIKYSVKSSAVESYEIATNTLSFNSKYNKMKNKCKKNNIYSKIDMKMA